MNSSCASTSSDTVGDEDQLILSALEFRTVINTCVMSATQRAWASLHPTVHRFSRISRISRIYKVNLDKRYCLFLCFTAILFLVFFAIFVSDRCKKIRPAGDSFPCNCYLANHPSRMLLPRRQLCGEKALVIMSYHWSISEHRNDF